MMGTHRSYSIMKQVPDLCKVHEMLEACIEVCLLSKAAYTPKVGVVDVGIHSEEALEHGSHHVHKIWREWDAILLREDP